MDRTTKGKLREREGNKKKKIRSKETRKCLIYIYMQALEGVRPNPRRRI
jgi:hypothetical protein